VRSQIRSRHLFVKHFSINDVTLRFVAESLISLLNNTLVFLHCPDSIVL